MPMLLHVGGMGSLGHTVRVYLPLQRTTKLLSRLARSFCNPLSGVFLEVFHRFLEIFLHGHSCCLQIGTVLFQPARLLVPFSIGRFFFFFFRNSSMLLNRDGKNGHPCLVPSVKGKSFSLSLLNMMSAAEFCRCSLSG